MRRAALEHDLIEIKNKTFIYTNSKQSFANLGIIFQNSFDSIDKVEGGDIRKGHMSSFINKKL